MIEHTYSLKNVRVEARFSQPGQYIIYATLFINKTTKFFGLFSTSKVRANLYSISGSGELVCNPNRVLTRFQLNDFFKCCVASEAPLRILNSLNEPVEHVFEDLIETLFSDTSNQLVQMSLEKLYKYRSSTDSVKLISLESFDVERKMQCLT